MLHTIFTNFKIKQTRFFIATLFLSIVGFTSCSDFVDIDVSGEEISPDIIFNNEATIRAAFASVYITMREQDLISGTRNGISNNLGLYTDELLNGSNSISPFFDNALEADTQTANRYWSGSYNLIYQINRIIAGLEASTSISTEAKNMFLGQALFLRAFLNSYLVELFGDIPIVTNTDPDINSSISRSSIEDVYAHIITDLTEAKTILNSVTVPQNNERIFPDKYVVDALLARVYLYRENWTMAENSATALINNIEWEPDLNKVFNHNFTLESYKSRIWALKTDVLNDANTNQGILFFINEGEDIQGRNTINDVSGTTNLEDAFEPGDKRKTDWLGGFEITFGDIVLDVIYFPGKYRETMPTNPTTVEYPLVFRLAEQYLIRAEARAKLGNIAGAQEDLNMVRTRADLPNTTANSTVDLLDAVIQERRVELFTEYGHRFFDLKRTGRIDTAMLTAGKGGWNTTDILFPIPERELEVNPNLTQNPGY